MKVLEEFYDPADMSICVPASTTLAQVNTRVAADGLYFPLGFSDNQTIEELILTRRYSPASLKYGAIGDNVPGMTWILPGGRQVQLGSRVVKNVAGFDFIRFLCQSRGRLGKPALVVLRLRPKGEKSLGIEASGDFDRLVGFQQRVVSSSWAHVVDSCVLVASPEHAMVWTPFNSSPRDAGLVQAWLEVEARNYNLRPQLAQPRPYRDASIYRVQIQALLSKAPGIVSDLVKNHGGRAMALGGLGTVEYAPPEGDFSEGLKAYLQDLHNLVSKDGGHVLAEGVDTDKNHTVTDWALTLFSKWEAMF